MPDTDHPSREDLLAFLVGTLPEETAEIVGSHVDTCTLCQTTLGELDESDDALVAKLRQREGEDPYSSEPQRQMAVERAKAVTPDADDEMTLGQRSTPAHVPNQLGEFKLLEKIGQGGMGTVYKALHGKLQRVVALKMLPSGRADDPDAQSRFEREMIAIGRLDHPNIVRPLHAGEEAGISYLAREYVHGFSLSNLVRCVGPLPVPDACEIIRQTAMGLQAAYENGLVHRDIKPGNLMLTRQGEVKILDLGLARVMVDARDGPEMTSAGQAMGTADYMAPEQAMDSRDVDIRADLYGLGCTLYKLLTGHAPFSGERFHTRFKKLMAHAQEPFPSIRDDREDVPVDLAAAVEKLTAKSPDDRFATPAEVADTLGRFGSKSDLPDLVRRAEGSKISEEEPAQTLGNTAEQPFSTEATAETRPVAPAPFGSVPTEFGRYQIIERLGQGAMGNVFLAHDTQLQRKVALKVPRFRDSECQETIQRFYREARSAATLRNANICPIYDVGEIEGIHYISMAYIEGRQLSDQIDSGTRLPQQQVGVLVCKLARAVQDAHEHGVVHRDLKPSNIMIDEKHEPIIMDFGLAHQIDQEEDARLTQDGQIIGSPAYMSPEQLEGRLDEIGPACDVYGLGVILYELLTGETPFQGSLASVIGQIATKEPRKPSVLRPDVSPHLEAIWLKMMAKQIGDRYASMKDVADALTAYLASSPDASDPEGDFAQGTAEGVSSPPSAEKKTTKGSRTDETIDAQLPLPPDQELVALEEQYEALVAEHDSPLAELEDQLAALDAVRRRLEEAETVDMGTQPCSFNPFYEHRRYHLRWFDAAPDEFHKTPPSELCTGGHCHLNLAAETDHWERKTEVWQQWSELHQRLLAAYDNASPFRQRLATLEDDILRGRELLDEATERSPEPLPRPQEIDSRYTSAWKQPEQPTRDTNAAGLTDAEKDSIRQRIIRAIRDHRLPDDVIVERDGATYLPDVQATRFTTIGQLLSEEHRHDADIWIEILRNNLDEIQHASERLRSNRQFARRVLSESLELYEQARAPRQEDAAEVASDDRQIATRTEQERSTGSSADRIRPRGSWEALDFILRHLGGSVKNDEDAMLPALVQDGRAVQHLSDRLRSDKRFLIQVIDTVRERFGADHAAEVCKRIGSELPETLQADEEIAVRVVEACSGQDVMKGWSEQLHQSKSFAMKALSQSIHRRGLLANLSDELRDDEEVVMKALAGEGSAILAASDRLRSDREFLRRALSVATDPAVLDELSRLMRKQYDEEDPGAEGRIDYERNAADRLIVQVKWLPARARGDEELVLAALEAGGSLEGASDRLRNAPSFATMAVDCFGRNSVLDAVGETLGERVMEALGTKVRDNEQAMLAAVQRSGAAVKYASVRLRNSALFAVQALDVSEDVSATLEALSASLRNKETVMVAAAKADPLAAVQHASPRLRANRRFADVVLTATDNPDEIAPHLQGKAAQYVHAPPSDPETATPTKKGRVRPADVMIVGLGAIFALAMGFALYLSLITAISALVVLSAIGAVTVACRSVAGRIARARETQRATSASERVSPAAWEDLTEEERHAQIDLAKRVAKQYLDDDSES